MKYEELKIYYSFKPAFGLKIGSGHGKYGIIDNSFRTRQHPIKGQLYPIPGTSVKGRIRSTYRKYSHLLPDDAKKIEERIFGTEKEIGWAHFSDLVPNSDCNLSISTNTSIDRFRKAAKQSTLRVEEYLQLTKDGYFSGTVEGFLPKNIEEENDLVYLLFAILATTHFGADKTSGYGKGETKIEKVVIDNKVKDFGDIKQFILNAVGGK